ncbi:MAG: HIT family protein [Bacteroidales bacterium]|nr:HIT family protein [Lentimicrobiaceae bacterium]MDD5695214.1 HIT family protein [Bacteroidales bacterium]
MSSIFARIASGEIPSYKIAADDRFFAFLDINPLTKGHTLVVPKKEIDYIFAMDDAWYRDFFSFARKVAIAIEKVVDCKRIGIAVVGLEVPHAHIHLVPMNDMDDLDFKRPKLVFTPEEFAEIARQISDQISSI